MLEISSEKRGDIVIFDEKIIFGDLRMDENPINSITTIEFKRPGRNDYDDKENPVRQAFRLINGNCSRSLFGLRAMMDLTRESRFDSSYG